MTGILDIKWCPSLIETQSLFGLVNSIGELQIHSLNEGQQIDYVTSIVLGQQVLGLSLDWSNRVHTRYCYMFVMFKFLYLSVY